MSYLDFIDSKSFRLEPTGFDVPEKDMNEKLFPFQKAIVRWALKRGRSAIFADTGLGKAFMELEWAWQVFQRTGNRVLILTPLCVAEQLVMEANKFGYAVQHVRDFKKDGSTGLFITNYEMLEKFEDGIRSGYFDGIVLDESSIIKHKDSKTRNQIISVCRDIPYKLSATATPSPNDYMELGNQAEFLGVMSMYEMLSMFFIHDSGETSKWRLKGHGEKKFWEWLATWAVAFKKPSDLGFSDEGYILPKLKIEEVIVPSKHRISDNTTLSGRNEARRLSIDERVHYAAEIMNADKNQWIAWCNLNDESAKLTAAINGSVEVVGSFPLEKKVRNIESFASGESRVIVSKPSITGFGLNWQHCYKMVFVGLNDSYEQLYQSVRRCYRFGQKKSVTAYLITSQLEGAVRENILEKEKRAEAMSQAMVGHMRELLRKEIFSLKTEKTEYLASKEFQCPPWVH